MNKQEFLRRCETVWDKGVDRGIFSLMLSWLDFVLRYEHTMFSPGQGQGEILWTFLESERERIGAPYTSKTLANDKEGYKLQEIASILAHPCQQCAEDLQAWHTRFAFCSHTKPVVGKEGQ